MAKDGLSDEDRILWNRVARTVKAYPGKTAEPEPNRTGTTDTEPVAPKIRKAPARKPGPVRQPPTRDMQPIDRSVYRKLSRGRLPLDATIDLHGLTQSEAHGLLYRFLVGARERGLRHVLVITGKGRSNDGEGVLRRAVPLWLSMPEFSGLASGIQPAGRGHGGEGALYVRLKKKEKGR